MKSVDEIGVSIAAKSTVRMRFTNLHCLGKEQSVNGVEYEIKAVKKNLSKADDVC